MDSLTDKVGIVTGAASGIGRAVADAFAAEGMHVVLADIEAEPLAAAVEALRSRGHRAIGVPTDVSSLEAIQHLAAAAIDEFGRIDVVHNNAGVVTAGLIEEISLAAWRWVIDVDLWSVIYGAMVFAPILKRQGSGHIVNTASTAGLQANHGIGPYNVAKFGVVALSETLRIECEGTGVGVSVLCPGAIDTQIVAAERNRPTDVPGSTGPTAERFTANSTAMLGSRGLPPSAVGAMVVDAVKTDRFWVLTHPRWFDVVAQRTAAMPTGELTHDFGG